MAVNRDAWPPNLVTTASPATEIEAKTVREVLTVAQTESASDGLDEVRDKRDLRRTLRIAAWVTIFISNCKTPKKLLGPLTTKETEKVKWKWMNRVQQQGTTMSIIHRSRGA